MDATHIAGGADSQRGVGLGHAVVRYLCEREAGLHQKLHVYIAGTRIGCANHLGGFHRGGHRRDCRAVRRVCAHAQHAGGQHCGVRRAGKYDYRLSHHAGRGDVYQRVVYLWSTECSGQYGIDGHGDGLPGTNCQHHAHDSRSGLFAALADQIHGGALQQRGHGGADGRHAGARVGGRVGIPGGHEEHHCLHGVLQDFFCQRVDAGRVRFPHPATA